MRIAAHHSLMSGRAFKNANALKLYLAWRPRRGAHGVDVKGDDHYHVSKLQLEISMAELKTTYLGLNIDNPIIAGASALTSNMQTIRRIAEAGAGALVIASLFEEQVQFSQYQLEEDLQRNDNLYAEMTSMFPNVVQAGPQEHIMWVKRAKEAVDIPVIASLNAVNRETWVEYAQVLEGTGVDGLELNFYSLPLDFNINAQDVEDELLRTFQDVRSAVKLPLSLKLSSYYTSPLQFIKRLDDAGADGFVLFNRLFHPKINIEKESNDLSFNLSSPNDHRLALRFTGLLHGEISSDICANTGIHNAGHVIEMIMAGASAVQVVSTLFRNKIEYLQTMKEELATWMDDKGYNEVDAFKGKMSKKNNPDPWAYTRAKYVKVLRSPGQYMMK